MHDRDRLRALLVERSLQFGDFTLASGERSSYYIDARRTTMSAEGQHCVGRIGFELIREHGLNATVVGGLTMGADPIAYAIAHASWIAGQPVDAFSVRKAGKEHGMGRLIEGTVTPGARAVIVEDVITTGESALQAIRAVEDAGGTVAGVFALVDRQSGGRARLEDAGYPVVAVFTASELLESARSRGSADAQNDAPASGTQA
ncbi:MAG: orotate phosphoribosyltransferase [Gemmatimonadetes bacterium]|nr:orotate phosphoribosyltransferase [Gemmatimonadota bacterium]